MKAIFVGGTCAFCEWIIAHLPHCWEDTEGLVKGRAYTIVEMKRYELPNGLAGYGVKTLEGPLIVGDNDWRHCSCQFREVDGDEEAWRETMRCCKPTKEKQPA